MVLNRMSHKDGNCKVSQHCVIHAATSTLGRHVGLLGGVKILYEFAERVLVSPLQQQLLKYLDFNIEQHRDPTVNVFSAFIQK